MTRILTLAGASLLVAAIAAPAAGQAVPRSAGGGSSSGSGSGSGSSSSSGDSSGGGGGGSHEPPVARRAPSTAQPRSAGGAQPRGGASTGASAASERRGGGNAGASRASEPGSVRLAQSRGARAATEFRGQAIARPYAQLRPTRPVFVGRYYSPWYFGGSVYSSSYYGYNPFGWRYSPFGYYGLYGFVPYGAYYYDPWAPYMYGGAGGGSYDRDRDRDDDRPVGSLRLRMNPRHAKVYLDGALVGMVDDFDGLRDHLDIDAGRHEIEVRADGYESYRTEVVVMPGKTTTERAKLKKK